MKNIAQRLAATKKKMLAAEQKYGRPAGSVRLLAVSKTRSPGEIREAFGCGQTAFGENYVQEALEKMPALGDMDLEWHFIGPVQGNKTRAIAEHFAWVHSLDRERIARRLNDARPGDMPPLNVCIQINTSGESSKSGILPAELDMLAGSISDLPRLRLRGLMTMPAPVDDPVQQRASLAGMRSYLEQLRRSGLEVDTLSMGTTADMEAAVAEGATMVRLGTAIFGPRP